MIKIALNGGKPKTENPNLPTSFEEYKKEIDWFQAHGLHDFHIHFRDPEGQDTLLQKYVQPQWEALKIACPGCRIGIGSPLLFGRTHEKRMEEINNKIAKLQQDFGNMLPKATNEAAIWVDKVEDLAGLSEADIAQCKKDAESRGGKAPYCIVITNTTQQPILASLDNRQLRERVFNASIHRTDGTGEFNTFPFVAEIAKLRAEKAELMGYKNYASYSLDNAMAKNTDNTYAFLKQLIKEYKPKAEAETKAIEEYARKTQGADFKLQPYDRFYYSAKMKKDQYNFSDDEVKPYFNIDSVLVNGVFYAANKVYGLTFKERKDIPTYHPDMKVFEVFDVNVYTHSEMLPAHGYPELKRRYPHLKGNFGTAWQNQQREFEDIPAPILFTTNCIMPLRASYADRVFTTSVVAYPGVPHIDEGRDFSPVIEKALELGGYAQDTLLPGLNGGSTVTTGFARTAVLQHADEIVQAVRDGKLRHFFLVGGCDGTRPSRRYYTEFARLTPPDTILLTLACGKFRLNDLPLGTVPGTGLPRILDVGQCNDAYSAIRIALALADAFGCGVNDLPLSLVLCWFEQKAVCILIALLALGIRNIRLGPTLPPFLSPVVVAALQQKYDLKAVTTPENDLQAILGRH